MELYYEKYKWYLGFQESRLLLRLRVIPNEHSRGVQKTIRVISSKWRSHNPPTNKPSMPKSSWDVVWTTNSLCIESYHSQTRWVCWSLQSGPLRLDAMAVTGAWYILPETCCIEDYKPFLHLYLIGHGEDVVLFCQKDLHLYCLRNKNPKGVRYPLSPTEL